MNRNACTLYLQSNKENLVKLMKEKGDGVEDLKLGATFVLLTLPLSDPDFEDGGSMLNKEGSHVLASPLKGNNNLTIKL